MHPILIQIGDKFFIGTYGLMIAIGLIAAIVLASTRGKRRGFNPELFMDLAFVAIISGFISARLLFIILNWELFMAQPMAIIFSRSGFVFLGGFIGAVGCTIVYLKKFKNLPILPVGDVVAPSIPLAHAFGRIGCYLAGCCWGGVCENPNLGVTFERHLMPTGEPFINAYEYHLDAGLIPHGATESLPVWPTQLMESGALFVLTAILLLYASKPRRPGQTLALYLGCYSIMRFVLELFRGDADRGYVIEGILSTSQFLSLLILPVAVGLYLWSLRRPISPHSHPSTAPPPPETEQEKKPAAEPEPETKTASQASRRRKRR